MKHPMLELFRQALKDAHDALEGTMQGVDDKVAHWQPKGKALPVGAAYTHVVISEDLMLNNMIRNAKPLLDQGWSKKLNISHPHPTMDMIWETNFAKWVKEVKIDLPKLQKYAQAVYKQTDDYLATLSDKDLLEKKVDLSQWGLGEWQLGRFIMRIFMGHIDNLMGEISAAKGLQGLKGYPF